MLLHVLSTQTVRILMFGKLHGIKCIRFVCINSLQFIQTNVKSKHMKCSYCKFIIVKVMHTVLATVSEAAKNKITKYFLDLN